MMGCRGPGFKMPQHAGFEDLPAGASEPTAEELADLVDSFYAAAEGGDIGSMGESDKGVVFQGKGDPLEAIDTVLETVSLVAERRNSLAFRLNTLALCDSAVTDQLLKSGLLQLGDEDSRRETRIARVSVFLPAADPKKYAELVQPNSDRGFRDVCSFIATLAEAGADIECTAVARPDIDVKAVENLAMSLGARTFRTRSWVE